MNHKILKIFLLLFFIFFSCFAADNEIRVDGVLLIKLQSKNPEILHGKIKLNKISENDVKLIKATAHWFNNGNYHVAQSNPLRFNSKQVLNKNRIDLNKLKDKKDIFISYGSGDCWIEKRNAYTQEKFASAHYYDPDHSEIIFINLGYKDDVMNKVLIFISSNIDWNLLNDFLDAVKIKNEIVNNGFLQTIQFELFSTYVEIN